MPSGERTSFFELTPVKIHGTLNVLRDASCVVRYMVKVEYEMLFATFLGCIEAIARLGEGATTGCIRKMNSHLSHGQVLRALRQLEGEGYVSSRMEPHGRTGKVVWYLSNRCVTNIQITSDAANDAGYISEKVSA